jgi:hypothetical protein
MSKKFILIILFFFTILILTGCNQIEDSNGNDDYTIQTISNEDIIKKSSYSALGFVETNINGKYTKKANKFSGVYKVLSVEANNEKLSISMESSVTAGNFRIVLIKGDEIIDDFELNTTDTITIDNANGTYIVKIVGESAKFTLKYSK